MNAIIKKFTQDYTSSTIKADTILEAKSNKLDAFKIAEKQENNELYVIYKAMQDNADKYFTCHDINDILQKGTNIASRIFRKLEAGGLIKQVESVIGLNGVSITAFKIVDASVNLDLNKVKEYTKKQEEDKDILNKINRINEQLLLNTNIDYKTKQKIVATLLSIYVNYKTKQKIVNMFNSENIEKLSINESLTLINNILMKFA